MGRADLNMKKCLERMYLTTFRDAMKTKTRGVISALAFTPGMNAGGVAKTNLERKSRADLHRSRTRRAEGLIHALCRLAEVAGDAGLPALLADTARLAGIERKRITAQVSDVEGVEHLAQDGKPVTLLDGEHFRQPEVLREGRIAELVILRQDDRGGDRGSLRVLCSHDARIIGIDRRLQSGLSAGGRQAAVGEPGQRFVIAGGHGAG